VARGRVVDEAALTRALAAHRIAGAGLDVTADEPPAPGSLLWKTDHMLITPHTAGATRRYER
jgi:phosphoglycerate dehydrogenase-like enzyme